MPAMDMFISKPIWLKTRLRVKWLCPLWLTLGPLGHCNVIWHQYSDVIMGAMASQIISLTIVYSTVYSGADLRKHRSSASLAIRQWGTRQSQSIFRPTNHKRVMPARSPVTTAIWWPLGVAVVSVTCMRVRWISHTWKYTQRNICLFESSEKSPYWTNPHHIGFRYVASLNFHTYFGQCPNDIYILLHIPLSCLSKLPAHGAYDCHGPYRPPDGYSSISNGLLEVIFIPWGLIPHLESSYRQLKTV